MCGITGYIGIRETYPIIINGLQRLEYRGYDSAGIMLFDGKNINFSKTKGKVSNLEDQVRTEISNFSASSFPLITSIFTFAIKPPHLNKFHRNFRTFRSYPNSAFFYLYP